MGLYVSSPSAVLGFVHCGLTEVTEWPNAACLLRGAHQKPSEVELKQDRNDKIKPVLFIICADDTRRTGRFPGCGWGLVNLTRRSEQPNVAKLFPPLAFLIAAWLISLKR